MNGSYFLNVYWHRSLSRLVRLWLLLALILNGFLPTYATTNRNGPAVVSNPTKNQPQNSFDQHPALESSVSSPVDAYSTFAAQALGDYQQEESELDECYSLAGDDTAETIDAFSPAVYLLDLLDFVKDSFGEDDLETTEPTSTENPFNPPHLGSTEQINERFNQSFEDVIASESVEQQRSYVQLTNEILENLIVELDEENLKDEHLLLRDDPWISSYDSMRTRSIAWGDMDGDGNLDLAVADEYWGPGAYVHFRGELMTVYDWSLDEGERYSATSVAWGDMNGDGDLDLAVGSDGSGTRVYRNDGKRLQREDPWISYESPSPISLAWGDMDGDGYPELAVADLVFNHTAIYLNMAGVLEPNPSLLLGHVDDKPTSLAWGDVNGDGYLDLAVGNNGGPKVYLNNKEGRLQTTPSFASTSNLNNSVAWGDVDGDGYPELAAGDLYGETRVYRNDEGVLRTEDPWASTDSDHTTSVAWGDVDGDGDLDLAVGGYSTKVYRNDEGVLRTEASWFSTDNTTSIAWGDVDGDGDLDLAVGIEGRKNKIYRNETADIYATKAGFAPDVWEDLFDSYLRELETTREEVQLLLKVRSNVTESLTSNFLAEHDLEESDLESIGKLDGRRITAADVTKLRDDILKRAITRQVEREYEAETILCLSENLRQEFRLHLTTAKKKATEELFLALVELSLERHEPVDDEQALQQKWYEARACIAGMEEICPDLPDKFAQKVPVNPLAELKVFSQKPLISIYNIYYGEFIDEVDKSIQQMATEGKFDELRAQEEAEILLLTLAKLVFEIKQREPAFQSKLETLIAARTEEQWRATKIKVETGYLSKIRTNLIIVALRKTKTGSNRPFEIEEVTDDNPIVNTKKNTDRLADYLLLDLLVDESHLTTPVAFAASRIQTFIQSARLGTVPNYSSIDLDESQWSWLKSYASWHARQVVAHYPEDFLIPEIRETISPSFEQVVERLNEGADVEIVAAEYLGEINDFVNIRYYTSLVINDQLFIFARNDDGRFFYSVVKEDGSWVGWRTVPANIHYFSAYPSSTDIKLIHTPGYLNFLRTGRDEEYKDYLYHIPIKLVGSRLESVDESDEGLENGESWRKTDVSLSAYPTTDDWFIRDWEILTHGEVRDSHGIPLGKGFIISAMLLHDWYELGTLGLDYFIINNGGVEVWPMRPDYSSIPVGLYDPRWDCGASTSFVEARAVHGGRGALWVMESGPEEVSLYYTPNNYLPADVANDYCDGGPPHHILIKEDFTGHHFGFFSSSLDEDRVFYEENGELVVLTAGAEVTRFRLSDELRRNADLENPITGAYIGDEYYIVGGLSYDSPSPKKWMSFYTKLSTEHQTNIGVPLIEDHPQLQDDQSTAKAFFAEMENDGGAYKYLEEYYLHLPTLVAEFLNQNQQYARAFEWLRKIYDPSDPQGSEDRIYPPFHPQDIDTCSYSEMQIIFEDKLDPYSVASECGNVSLSNVKMRHITNVLDWADDLFVQDTNESVNRARELYELAADIHKTLESPDETLVEESDGSDGFPVPENPMIKILQWRIESNLTKIRTNRNFAGVQRDLRPYATPLDPTRSLKGIASGGGIHERSIPTSPPSVYRYAFLLERAKYLASVAQQFENSMLSAIEKEEEATYSYLRARQDVQLERGNVTLQSLRLREAEDARKQAMEQLARANTQWSHYDDLINEGLNTYETLALVAMYGAAAHLHANATLVQILTWGLGGWGEVGQALSATASVFMTHASFERRKEEWEFQRDLAEHDITIADIGVDLADDRIDIVDKELEIANMRLGFANDVVEYMENERFTNAQLYRWMNRNLEDLYRDQLNMAIATAKAAQQALEFERQTSLDFIGYVYWDDEKRGLLGVEQLLADLEKMEQFRLTNTSRKREIEKTISLSSVAPAEFQRFLETGVLDFATPSEWFDRDFPGHYMRLIRDIRVTVVALVPPSEGVHATLSNSGISRVMTGEPFEEPTVIYRLPEAIAISSPYDSSGLFELNPQDPMLLPFEGSGVVTDWRLEMPKGANRFDYDTIFDVLFTIRYTAMEDTSYRQKVLTDMGQDDYGYVPIEALRSFSLRNGFPDQWYRFHNPVLQDNEEYADPYADPSVLSSGDTRPLKPYTMVIDLNENDFLASEEDCTVKRVTLSIQPSDEFAGEEREVDFKLKFISEVGSVFTDTITLSSEKPYASTEAIYQIPFGKWILQVDSEQVDTSWLEDILFIVEYKAKVHYIR